MVTNTTRADPRAQYGSKVRVHYKGMLEDGTLFAASAKDEPMGFTIGDGETLPGFEQAVIGMRPGETKTRIIQASDAYGEHKQDLVFRVASSLMPAEVEPEPGDSLVIQLRDGRKAPVTIVEVSESEVVLDANHRLAGKALTFHIELVAIEP